MPARPGAAFQPVLPGMGRVSRKAAAPVTPPPAPAWNDRRDYRGPQPGQLVMGVSDLADERMERNFWSRGANGARTGGDTPAGPYEVNAHGYVSEGTGLQEHDRRAGDGAAYHYYGTHGGRYAKTMNEAAADEGNSLSELGVSRGAAQDHDRKVREVKGHWSRQPTVPFPTDALVHTSQSIEETEGDPDVRETQRPVKRWAAQHTAGGSPVMGTSYTDVPGTGEGRGRIERIKRDLEQGRSIRKPIWMMKVNGRHFQLDGHHRMVAAREAGVSHVPVKLWDLDAARSTPPPREVLQHAVTKNPALAAHMHAGGTHANMLAALRDLAER